MHFWDRMAWRVSSPSHKTIDMNTGLLICISQNLVLGVTILKKGKFQSKYIVSLTQLKKNKFCNKSPLVSSKFEKVKFRWNQVSVVMATQNFKRNLLLVLYREGKKSDTCSLFLPAFWGRDKKRLTLEAYFLHLETPGLPACYLLGTCHLAPILCLQMNFYI